MKVSSFEKVTFKSHDHLCWQSDLVFFAKRLCLFDRN